FGGQAGRKTAAPPQPKNGHPPNNKRLEFLGDAILGMAITEMLYHRYPDMAEGEMTVIKSDLVSRPVLAEKSRQFGLDKLVIIGKGIKEKTLPVSILANIFESLLAAIYLDRGIEPVYKVIATLFNADIESASKNGLHKNYKALLQDYSQRRFSSIPHYKVVRQSGPKHQPVFEVMARVGNESYGPGIGHTKKEAEQAAAKTALEAIGQK
ncbi:MAG: ribonuclease III, partial [Planctomycetes bacterium]|nr:ribonuclease III [Planctomycetota bacterium]